MAVGSSFSALVELCARLRAPGGCPWDREQTLESLRAYIIEEAYEVVDAISDGQSAALGGELGDLLFQVVFVAQIAREQGWFDIEAVCDEVCAKMVRRHPHVFGDVSVENAAHVVRNWEAIKKRDRTTGGALAGVPRSLPALLKTRRMTEKAAALGVESGQIVGSLRPAARALAGCPELQVCALTAVEKQEATREIGQALFFLADLARRVGVDPEAALQAANAEFAQRFAAHEDASRAGV